MIQQEKKQDVFSVTNEKANMLCSRLGNDLGSEVYDPESVKLVNTIRGILDLKSLIITLRGKGIPLTAALKITKFIEDCRKLCHHLKDINDAIISKQYQLFLVRLNELCKSVPTKDLKSIEILTKLFKTSNKLYEGIEIIMQILNVAAVSMGIESILESQISVYEKHADGCRNLGEDKGCNKMHVALNGPCLNRKNDIIQKSLDRYFDSKKIKGWHFVRRTANKKNFVKSKVIDLKQKDCST